MKDVDEFMGEDSLLNQIKITYKQINKSKKSNIAKSCGVELLRSWEFMVENGASAHASRKPGGPLQWVRGGGEGVRPRTGGWRARL